MILVIITQTIAEMKDIVHGYLLVESIFEIVSEKLGISDLKIPFFEEGG